MIDSYITDQCAGFITLIPSMNIGIFTSMNGADGENTVRILFHNYIADLLLGEEPWPIIDL
jgi:hypothetical protein